METRPGAPPPDLPHFWPHRAASRRIACAPHRWHVQVMGQGPDLLLLHGAGASGHSFRALVPLLAERMRVIVPDLPGHGFTVSPPGSRRGLGAMAGDLATLCAAEGWMPAALAGHSAGGALALQLGRVLPGPPAAVIGLNPALGRFEGVAGWLFPALARVLAVNPLVPAVVSRLWGTDAQVRRLLSGTGSRVSDADVALYRHLVQRRAHVAGTLAMMAHWDLGPLIDALPGIERPCLFLTGETDRVVPPRVAAEAAARMASARCTNLPGTGHLMHEEAAEETAAAMLAFLVGHGAITPG